MGVSWVMQWPVPDPAGRSLPQVNSDIEKQLLAMGAIRSGILNVDSEPFFANNNIPGLAATIHLCHSSEYPESSFALVTESFLPMPCLVADKSFDQLMTKLNQAFSPRPNLKIEAKGQKYELSDFTIKVGSVIVGGSARGLLVEIEYNCCFVASSCANLIKEFSASVFGAVGQQQPIYFTKFKEAQSYTPMDTISQYLNHFIKFRTVLSGGTSGQSQHQQPLGQQQQQI